MRYNLILNVIALLVLCSCWSENEFIKRKYLTGRYKDKSCSVKSSNVSKVEKNDNLHSLIISEDLYLNASKSLNNHPEILTEAYSILKDNSSVETSGKLLAQSQTLSYSTDFINDKPNHKIVDLSKTRRLHSLDLEPEKQFAKKASKNSVIFGVLSVLLESLGLFMILSFGFYGFIPVIILGIVFGVLAVVFGSKGIQKSKRVNDEKSKKLSVIGLITGLIGILFGIGSLLYLLIESFTLNLNITI